MFLTERRDGDRVLKAAIKLIPAIPESGELQLSRWRLAALSHPHLIQLFETGSCELANMPLLYVVMEYAEENLAQVLSQRALTPAETREMLEPVLNVLGYLHGQGFVHGHIKPANIMADDDQLKLSSDALCRAGESVGGPGAPDAYPDAHAKTYDPPESAPGFIPPPKGLSPAGDVWSLGMTLVEVLTRHLPAQPPAGQGDDPLLPRTLPEPFLDIARHCLLREPESRWTVAKIAARLDDRTPVPQAPALVRPARPPSRPQRAQSRAHSNRRAIGVAIAIGVVLAAILLGPKLFRHDSEVPRIPSAALREPSSQPTSKPQAPLAPETEAEVQPAADASAPGEVIEQVLPEVPQSSRDTIQGTVRVTVRVDVDPSGEVQFAELETRGPSKYFASLAMQAAQHWGFKPPRVAGRGVLSTWTLRFEFTRAGATVIPTQEMP